MVSPIHASTVLTMRFGAVILAAGKSERRGQNKLPLRINDETLIDNVLGAVTGSNMDETVVVLGHDCQRIIEAVRPRLEEVDVVINEAYELGMTSSFQKGLRVT
jgi:molybdenum cofactor cytidylyltransferase